MLGFRVAFLLLLLAFGSSDASRLSPRVPQDFEYRNELANQAYREDLGSDQLCALCEEYAEIVLEYLANNTTEKEIIEVLYVVCALLGSYEEQQCTSLVDYFISFLFSEISSLDADTLCQDLGLCSGGATITSLTMKENRYKSCDDTVSDALTRLQNPDTRLGIIHTLLKGCDSRKNYTAKCKKTVFEHAPSLISNIDQLWEAASRNACTNASALAKPVSNMKPQSSYDS